MVSMRPIDRKTLSQEVVNQILTMIYEGEYRPGDRLPSEREIGERLGVGRTSVREGLQHLGQLGVLDIRQGRGIVVRSVTLGDVFKSAAPITALVDLPVKEIRDIMHVRQVLELESAALAADHREEEDLAALRTLLVDMERCQEDPDAFLNLDLAFHVQIAVASRNVALVPLLKLLRDLYVKHSETILRDPEIVKSSLAYHKRLLRAIEDQDPGEARKVMLDHLQVGERAVITSLT